MERLTKHYAKGITTASNREIICSNYCNMCSIGTGNCTIVKHMVERLAEIEDILGDDYDLDRLKELVQADREGRCVVLSEPMKPMAFKPNDTDVYCPNCGQTLSGGWQLSDADDHRKLCQCPKCGQSIDDTKCEEAALEKMKEDK